MGEILFVGAFVVFFIWAAGQLSRGSVGPRATSEQLEEAGNGLKSFWFAMLLLVVFFVLAIGGTFTTGFDMGKLENNGSWVMTGDGAYRR